MNGLVMSCNDMRVGACREIRHEVRHKRTQRSAVGFGSDHYGEVRVPEAGPNTVRQWAQRPFLP